MARLGSFGDASQPVPEPDTYLYFGAELRINPQFTDADMFDFVETSGDLKEEDPAAVKALKDLMRNIFLPEDFDTFWALAKQHGQNIDQRLAVALNIIEALAGRPTGRSSGSSGGPPNTAVISMADYALAAQRRLEEEGRPDLAVAALRFRQAQQRAATG